MRALPHGQREGGALARPLGRPLARLFWGKGQASLAGREAKRRPGEGMAFKRARASEGLS
jgi:hypothetical protein